MNNKYALAIGILILIIGGIILAYPKSKKESNIAPSSSPAASTFPSSSHPLVSTSVSTPETSVAPAPIGSAAIFNNVDIEKWHACKGLDCVSSLMKESGASPKSIAFTELLYSSDPNNLGYLSKFKEMGKIDLGTVYFPDRANTNEVYYLLNGSPALVSTEEIFQNKETVNAIKQDPLYTEVKNKYPDIEIVDVSNSQFTKKDILPDNAERFIFKFELKNGCYACSTEYSVSIGFDFDPNGKFLKTTFLQIEK